MFRKNSDCKRQIERSKRIKQVFSMSKSYFHNVNYYYYCMFKKISLTGMKFKYLVLQTWQGNDIAGYASALLSSFSSCSFWVYLIK